MIQNIQAELKKIDDKTEISEYLRGFLLSYGIPRATLVRLGLDTIIPVDKTFAIGNKLCCTYTNAVNLYAKYDYVQRNIVKNNRYRIIMLINEEDILALDTQSNEWLMVSRDKIHSEFEFFLPIAGIEKTITNVKKNANIKIGEKFAQFYNELLMLNPGKESTIQVLMVNLVAMLFADSCGVLTSGCVHHYIDLYSKNDGSDLGRVLNEIFTAVAGGDCNCDYLRDNRNASVVGLPVCESCLCFDKSSRSTLISLCALNWDSVEPEVIGALIQAIFNPEAANISYNYTSTANIYKVIGPLFMDDLFEEYEKSKRDNTLSSDFLNKISLVHIFDPACGSGNFLMICFKELKKLEKLIKEYYTEHRIQYEDKDYITYL